MATLTNIIEFSRSYEPRTPVGADAPTATVEAGERKPPETVTLAGDGDGARLTERNQELQSLRLTQKELYPAQQAFSTEHVTALRLLGEGIVESKRALDAIASRDVLIADLEMQKLQMLLPELFCCRALGDGFGTLVNSLMSAFEGLAGETPNTDQMRMMSRVLRLLSDKPFLSTSEADEQLDALESVGLNPYPAELMDFLSSEQSVR
ncbi:MAG TPA: hypothetical protein VKF84_11545 [Candidatus Sulfotelmatobacter sp.]|nr:hypothetical protein [Candidatus Sulfotelmatobacter sp.]